MEKIIFALLSVRDHFFGDEDERGATAVEYALMVALIAVVIIGGVTLLGGNVASKFSSVANSIGK